MTFKISIRLISENIESLNSLNTLPYNFKLLKKGEPVRPKSNFKITQNMMISNCIEFNTFDDKNVSSIINIINSLKITDKKIKKELLISNITESDQYGFELSSNFLKCISENNFSIVFTGIFI